VDGERVIPLTPYVASLLVSLPKRNEWVFSSTRVLSIHPANVNDELRGGKRKGRHRLREMWLTPAVPGFWLTLVLHAAVLARPAGCKDYPCTVCAAHRTNTHIPLRQHLRRDAHLGLSDRYEALL
jgi:hypothetical protein